MFGFATAASAAIVHLLWPTNTPATQQLSLAFGYASFAFLAFTLQVGPLNVIRRRPNPKSSDLRRDAGLFAAGTGGIHVVLALQHHFGGHVAQYFVRSGRVSAGAVRLDLFGTADWLGIVAVVIFALLAASSNDWALRALGRRWKQVQRWNYALAVLVIVHTLVFWHLEHRRNLIRAVSVTAIAYVVVVQALAFAHIQRAARLARTHA